MQVVTNEQLIKRQARIAQILMAGTFVMLGVGVFLTFQIDRLVQDEQTYNWLPLAITYGLIAIIWPMSQIANARIRRFAPHHRHEARLRQLLKGLDDRFVLYSFLNRRLPDYMLVGPSGVYVLTTRVQQGEIVCQNDRWARQGGAIRKVLGTFYGNPLGRPTWDTHKGIQQVRELLSQRLGNGAEELPVQGLVVFTAEAVKLRMEHCAYPATTGRELRKVVGKIKTRLSPGQLAEIRGAFDELVPK